MTFKAFNSSAGFNRPVSTLLMFRAYSQITKMDVLSSTITQHMVAMQKAIDEV